ncbi:hypothetical protein DL768_010773 [Monosporascus sp. mg162]|nr:hypothetical protein DL768_010773 [Monosporascus sp. mg162]
MGITRECMSLQTLQASLFAKLGREEDKCYEVSKNFIHAALPPGGTTDASGKGSQYTAGALGRGSVISTAMTETFKCEKAVTDPEESINSAMLWFLPAHQHRRLLRYSYTYLTKLIGCWGAYLIFAILYFVLPALLWYLNNKGDRRYLCARKPQRIGRKGFWNIGKPSVRKAAGSATEYGYDDDDGAPGAAANAITAGMDTCSLPNGVLDNLNSVSIAIVVLIMSQVVYPLLRRFGIKWDAMSRRTFGFMHGTIGSIVYAVLQHYVYKTSPCNHNATTCAEILPQGAFTLSRASYSWYTIPVTVTAISQIFVDVTAYGIAYSRSPKNMKWLVASLNLFMNATSTAIASLSPLFPRDSDTENGIEKRLGGTPADSDSSNEKAAIPAPQEEDKVAVEKT